MRQTATLLNPHRGCNVLDNECSFYLKVLLAIVICLLVENKHLSRTFHTHLKMKFLPLVQKTDLV